MFDLYNEKKTNFDNQIRDYFPNSEFGEILNYSIDSGKRIRPLILIETHRMLSKNSGENDDLALQFALALEFIHNYSLIHDDLPAMDDDNYRRDRKTTHYKYGEDMAILAGDALLNYAFEILFDLIKQNNDQSIVSGCSYLSKASGMDGMILGQIYDIKDNINNLDDLITMYKNKTCRLIMSATTIPAYINKLDSDKIEDLEELGFCIGMAFQLQDDLLDIKEDEDIEKLTYLKFRGIDGTRADIIKYSNRAKQILEEFDSNEFLVRLIEGLINRTY